MTETRNYIDTRKRTLAHTVMPGLVPGIHDFLCPTIARRGSHAQGMGWRMWFEHHSFGRAIQNRTL